MSVSVCVSVCVSGQMCACVCVYVSLTWSMSWDPGCPNQLPSHTNSSGGEARSRTAHKIFVPLRKISLPEEEEEVEVRSESHCTPGTVDPLNLEKEGM